MTNKKLYIILGAVVFAIAAVVGTHYIVRIVQRNSDTVYINMDKESRVYHCTIHCKVLKQQQCEVTVVNKESAQHYYRLYPCAYCYGKNWE